MSATSSNNSQLTMKSPGEVSPAPPTPSGEPIPAHPLMVSKPRTVTSKEAEEEIMKEVCSSNGVNYNRIASGETVNCELLEIFFSGYPRIIGLSSFPSLKKLVIMNQMGIQKLEGLMTLTKLTELWICECDVKKIENLQYLKHLRKLYLYHNNIKVIENLDHLQELEVLWLNQNQIVNIENVSHLTRLKSLNLAENFIEKIGHTLDANHKLEDLNLSGNRISSLRDLTNLMRLPSLTSLSLKDPLFAPAPVSLLCNYSTHVLYHLPEITKLDTYDVSSKAMIELAETTVMKKKMYYNMRVKTVYRNLAQVISKMNSYKQQMDNFPFERLRSLISAMKEIEREIELPAMEDNDEQERDSATPRPHSEISDKQLNLQKLNSSLNFTVKIAAIKERVKKWEKKCKDIEAFYEETVIRFRESATTLVNRMVVELESGGNVRFEEGTPSDMWFTSCHDLVLSRFCNADYRDHGVVGIKIRRIIRVHNRILRSQFDEKLISIVDDTDGEYYISNRNVSYKKLLEYLFWMWDPQLPGGAMEPERILEEGFMDADTYKQLGRDGAVPLSNSLSLADRHRINHLMNKARGKDPQEFCPFKYGQLVIAKVYLGKNAKALDDKMIQGSSYPKLDAVYRPRKMCMQAHKPTVEGANTCECSSRQCEWYIFDHELVLPEYIIEFEYITKMKPKSPFAQFNEVLLDNKDCTYPNPLIQDEDKMVDSDVLNMDPHPKPRPRLIAVTDDLLLKITCQEDFDHITVLNLHGNGLTKLKPLQALKMLKRLVVSFNELTKLDDLAHMSLEQLDASFNKITSLEGMKGLHKLKLMDVSWNKITNTKEELSILRKHTPNLNNLDLRYNPWQKPDNLRLRVIGRLKSLTVLNGSSVTEAESSAALRVAAGSRISQVSLLSYSRTDSHRPRSLSLKTTAQILYALSRSKPEKLGDHDTHWYTKITAINLDKQHITKLSNLDKLENLKYASFNENDITKIEGLDNCHKLEELSLENNCINKLDGISKLTQLRRLSLGHNFISSLEDTGLQNLTHLHYLAVDNNNISSIMGLQSMVSLVELYVGNNHLANIRDVFHLKGLTNLVILDMFGNPLANDNDNYRLFVIYHLKTLKALDGGAIESGEGNNAKDLFGGRLTPDFVAEKLGHANFLEVREMDLPNSGIRIVDLGPGDIFLNLRSVNLEHNNLTSFSGLIHMPNLRVLCLNHNRIECIMPRQKNPNKQKTSLSTNTQNMLRNGADLFNTESSMSPVLENLEVLHLGYNCIKDMAALQLSRLTGLKALFLQGNEIQRIDGLEALHDLRELVLDRNKIKSVCEMSFVNQWNLQELHMEENRLRELTNLNCLENLQRLYLGSNRVQEIAELENLDGLHQLIEISLVNNAAARRHLHRPIMVFRLKNLMVIDGIPVTEEERTKAELYFMDQQMSGIAYTWVKGYHNLSRSEPFLMNNLTRVFTQKTTSGNFETTGDTGASRLYKNETEVRPALASQGQNDGSLPGIGQYKTQIPVKVTNMQLATSPMWNGSIYYDDPSAQDPSQRGTGRRRSKQSNGENGAPAQLGRTNTMYNNQTSTGYGGFTYTTSGNRAQFYLNQIPYVAAQSSQTAEYVEWLTRMNNSRNNRR